MRNIKTTLRFARNSALLFVAASGMAYLTGCSETDIAPDNGNGNNGDENVLVEALGVTAGTNPNLATTYDNSHQLGTRATNDVPEFPGMPKLPSSYDFTLDPSWDANCYTVMLPSTATESDFPTKIGNNFYIPEGYAKGLPAAFKVRYAIPYSDDNPGYVRLSKEFEVTAPNYYIDKEVSIAGFGTWGGTARVHILNGGALYNEGSPIQSCDTVYVYGGGKIVTSSTEENKIDNLGVVICEADLDLPNITIKTQGSFYTTGKLNAKSITLIGADVYAGCAITASDFVYFTGDNSVMKVGYVSAPLIQLSGQNPYTIVLRDGGYLEATNKLEINNLYGWGENGKYSKIKIKAETDGVALITTDVLKCDDGVDLQGTFYDVAINYNSQEGYENGAEAYSFNESTNINGAKGQLEVETNTDGSCAPKWVHNPGEDKDTNNPNKPGTETPDPETPGPETPGPGSDPTDPILENIGSVAPTGDHTHPISATCVSTNGDKAYLSWHTQGPDFHGCIEYLSVANGVVDLKAYLETSPSNDTYGAIDFNHVLYDDGKIFVAGDHPKKGGILGWIYCNNDEFVTGQTNLYMRALYEQKYEKEGSDPKYVNSGSGNCIIRNGDYYQVASIKGFETFKVGDFASDKYIVTDENGMMKFAAPKSVARLGSWTFDPTISADPTTFDAPRDGTRTGKHIATDGKYVVMLTLINRNNSSNTATASIKVYSAGDVEFKSPLASYQVNDAVLSPVDGKDVIAIDDTDIWVCLGQGGVQHLKFNGSEITQPANHSFVLKDMSKEQLKGWDMSVKEAASYCANGLAVDDKYLYIAHGGAGLIVLDRENMSFVTRTRYHGGKSANYIKLSSPTYSTDQIIYVAYGQSNLQIYGWKK